MSLYDHPEAAPAVPGFRKPLQIIYQRLQQGVSPSNLTHVLTSLLVLDGEGRGGFFSSEGPVRLGTSVGSPGSGPEVRCGGGRVRHRGWNGPFPVKLHPCGFFSW